MRVFDDQVFIHYGSTVFEADYFKPVRNIPNSLINKPIGGLWASPVDSKFGWKDFCIRDSYNIDSLKRSFKFIIPENCKILKIETYDDLRRLPLIEANKFGEREIKVNFEKLARKYDIIWLTLPGLSNLSYCKFKPNFYGWDCESVLVTNYKCIIKL